jgi:hypothetical protein
VAFIRRFGFFVMLLVVTAATVLAYLGALPPLVRSEHADKALHFLLFGLLAFFWVLRWGDGRWRIGPFRPPKSVVVLFAVAAVEELLQGLSSRRSLDAGDLACDFAGLVTFWWLGRRFLRASARRVADRPVAGGSG